MLNLANLVEVDKAKVEYGRTIAVDGVSFTLQKGRTLALLGTNGAGKTSLLDCCLGLNRLTGGSVTVVGKDPIADHREIAQRVGAVLQSAGIPKGMTTREVLTLWRALASYPVSMEELVDEIGLGTFLDRKVSKLSGGEKRRLDIACGLIGSPELLFLDEPTTGLDPESRRAIWELLARKKAEGISIVLTTHYLEEAEFLADDVVILHDGVLAEHGTLDEIIARYPGKIVFEWGDNGPLPDLPSDVRRETTSDTVTVTSTDVQGDAAILLAWARDNGYDLSQKF